MLKFKALYKGMYDDLKDAEMFIDYALELKKNPDDGKVAKELADYARERMNHFKVFHELFSSETTIWLKSNKNANSKEMVDTCLWDISHEHMQDWAKKIKEKIESF